MKIFHLFSDWKWTGPSEPIVNLCKELEGRGHDVTLAYRKPPLPVEDSMEKRLLTIGLKATSQFHLDRPIKFYLLSSINFFPRVSDDTGTVSRLEVETKIIPVLFELKTARNLAEDSWVHLQCASCIY